LTKFDSSKGAKTFVNGTKITQNATMTLCEAITNVLAAISG